TPQVLFDFSGVKVLPDPEAIWNAILDRSAVSYFDLYTVKTVPGVFNQVPDHPDDQIVALLVDFEGGGTAELNATTLAAAVRVDFPIDDVILRRPVTTSGRDPTSRSTTTIIDPQWPTLTPLSHARLVRTVVDTLFSVTNRGVTWRSAGVRTGSGNSPRSDGRPSGRRVKRPGWPRS